MKSTYTRRLVEGLVALALLTLIPSASKAQYRTITPYSGYRLGGTVLVEQGDLKLDDAAFYGAQIDVRVRPDATGFFAVDYQPTTLRLKEFNGPTEELFDMDVWYFQAGGTFEVLNQGAGVVPFALGSLGMSWFDAKDKRDERSSEYGVAGIFGAGAKIPLQSGRMALRLQARVLLNSLWGGASFWCGTGGCSVGAGGPIGPVQFDFGGGITFGGR